MTAQLTTWEDFGLVLCSSKYYFNVIDESFGFKYNGPEPEGRNLPYLLLT